MSDKTEESYKLDANSALLKSKGFILFTVDEYGNMDFISHILNLNPAECTGLFAFSNNKSSENIDFLLNLNEIDEEEDEDDEDI